MDSFLCKKCGSDNIINSYGQYECQQCGNTGSSDVCHFCKHSTMDYSMGGDINMIRFRSGLYCNFHKNPTSPYYSCISFSKG